MNLSDLSALFLASTPLVPAPTVVPAPPRWGTQLRDFLPILLVVMALTLILVVCLTIVRTRRRRRRLGSQEGVTLVRYRSPKLEDTGLLSLFKPRRRRRRKHRYHHRNPTLAETGGLPPIRQPAGGATPSSPAGTVAASPSSGSAPGPGTTPPPATPPPGGPAPSGTNTGS
jgi:hypothetical protein